MPMFDIITIGSATEDVFVNIDETQLISFEDADHRTDYLALSYGAKISVDSTILDTGGGGVNTAATFAKMGLKTAAFSNIGRDLTGKRVIEDLEQRGVDTSLLIQCADHPTGISVILTGFTGDRTILVSHGAANYLQDEDIPRDEIAQANWIYIASLHGESAPMFGKVATFADEQGVQVAINPGSTQLDQGIEGLGETLKQATVMFLNQAEAYQLTGVEPLRGPSDERQMLRMLYQAGCQNVVMTVGAAGSWGYDGRSFYTIPAYPTEVVSTVGAGDAFAAACVVGLHKGLQLNEAMRIGAANAASVVSQFGAKEGILSWQEAQDFMKARLDSSHQYQQYQDDLRNH